MVQKKLPLINSAHGSETRNIINEIIKAINDRGLEILSESSFLTWLDDNGIKHQGEWDDAKEYDRLSVVLHEGNSYTSIKPVPAGVEIFNKGFWVLTGNYDAQVDTINDKINSTDKLIKNAWIDVTRFGAVGDGVTDDTNAIREAINFMCSFAKPTGDSSWKSFMPTLFFPPNKYRVTEPGTLNAVGTSLQGYNIKGGGYLNTEISFDYTPASGESAYLLTNGGDNWFGRSYVEDITIRGNDKNSFWKITSQSGSPQANRFRRVGFYNLINAVTVDFGTHNYNADLFRFESCVGKYITGHVFGVITDKNSQSVVHSFSDCDFELIDGHILHFKSGGTVEVRGGSWIVTKLGRVIHTEDNLSVGIGPYNNLFTFYGTKFEWQHRDEMDYNIDRAPLVYNNSQAKIKFDNCNFGQFSSSGNRFDIYDIVIINRIGSVIFNDCYIPSVMRTRLEVEGSASREHRTPEVIFRNSKMGAQVNDLIKVVFLNNENSQGRNPTVIAESCRSLKSDEPVDVFLFKDVGNRYQTATKRLFTFIDGSSPDYGLPAQKTLNESKKVSFKLPVGSILRKIRVIYTNTATSSVYNVDVKNYNETTTFLNTQHIPSDGIKVFNSDELYYPIKSESDRVINVIGHSDNIRTIGIGGYIEVEYD